MSIDSKQIKRNAYKYFAYDIFNYQLMCKQQNMHLLCKHKTRQLVRIHVPDFWVIRLLLIIESDRFNG